MRNQQQIISSLFDAVSKFELLNLYYLIKENDFDNLHKLTNKDGHSLMCFATSSKSFLTNTLCFIKMGINLNDSPCQKHGSATAHIEDLEVRDKFMEDIMRAIYEDKLTENRFI